MKRKHQKTLKQIYQRPTSGNIKWSDIEALFKALGVMSPNDRDLGLPLWFLMRFAYFIDPIHLQMLTKEQLPVFVDGSKKMR